MVGNYGGAWQDQRNEFDQFPGAVLMTTNCIQRPKESYKARIYTELAQKLPQDIIIMTLACGKYRFSKLECGEVAGIP